MALQEREVSGKPYLDLVTTLCQRVRLESPTLGLWEAADFQWWWRRPRESDQIGQSYWLDDLGDPIAALVFSEWEGTWTCDPIVIAGAAEAVLPIVWSRALERIDAMAVETVETFARDDDDPLLSHLTQLGCPPSGAESVATWMLADDRPRPEQLPNGFRLLDRAHTTNRSHHMIRRSGKQVAERLSQTSLYSNEADLFVEAPNRDIAAYGLFWCDPVTKVGLVEPMRTEAGYQRLGLARHVFAERTRPVGVTGLHSAQGDL